MRTLPSVMTMLILLSIALIAGAYILPTKGAVTSITIKGGDYNFSAPAQVAAGLVSISFENVGHEAHHVQLVQLNDGVVGTYNLSAFVQSLLGTQGKHSPVSYRLLNEEECLFREQQASRSGRRNWSVHGRIRDRTLEGELHVQGYLDWSLVIFVLMLLGFLFLPISPLPMFPLPNFIDWQKVGAIIGLGFMFFYVLRARRLCDQIGRYFSQ